MKLDYIEPINEYGDDFVRLYDFGKAEAIKFRDLVTQFLIIDKTYLDLSTVEFIELRNCNLILRLSDTDEGIRTRDRVNFYCDLTLERYEDMIKLLKPYCERETKGYKFLYDLDTLTDFLFSPGGTW